VANAEFCIEEKAMEKRVDKRRRGPEDHQIAVLGLYVRPLFREGSQKLLQLFDGQVSVPQNAL